MIIPLLVVLVAGLAVVISVVVHKQGEPKRFLEAWVAELGGPQGMRIYEGGQVDDKNDQYIAVWRVICNPPGICADPTPFESVSKWLKDAGDNFSEDQVAECYRQELNCQRTIVKDGHEGSISLDQTSVLGNQYDMKVFLKW
ncbi:hypothetical protein [Actinomadura sp. KC06]|uniref:hypothetical protein n=1 Tax=Actinomadura sp. KC06 TaxID=2530369 RepID=UPI0014045B84|nr:hypothetical protein [Actinomadura sp. KC06]